MQLDKTFSTTDSIRKTESLLNKKRRIFRSNKEEDSPFGEKDLSLGKNNESIRKETLDEQEESLNRGFHLKTEKSEDQETKYLLSLFDEIVINEKELEKLNLEIKTNKSILIHVLTYLHLLKVSVD